MAEMRTVETLDELTELVRRCSGLFVRWSRGPAADAAVGPRYGAREPGDRRVRMLGPGSACAVKAAIPPVASPSGID